MDASITTRLITLPKIITAYFVLFLFPKDLSWGQHWVVTSPDFNNFYVPLIIVLIIILGLVLLLLKTAPKHKPGLVFFTAMAIFGVGLHSQLIPLDFTFAERWFYFPSAAFLGISGFIWMTLTKNDWLGSRQIRTLVLILVITLLITLSIRTFVRTLNWKDDFTLASHDVLVDTASFALENNLGYELIKRSQFREAQFRLEKSVKLYPDHSNYNNLAYVYSKLGEPQKAIDIYQKALQLGDSYNTYQNFVAELIRQSQNTQAKTVLETGLTKYPNNPKLWLLLAVVEYNLGNTDQALTAVKKADFLSPGIANFVFKKIQNKEPINL